MAKLKYHGQALTGTGLTVVPMTRAEYEANKEALDKSQIVIEITDEEPPIGGGGSGFIEVTYDDYMTHKEEYDATNNAYFITDVTEELDANDILYGNTTIKARLDRTPYSEEDVLLDKDGNEFYPKTVTDNVYTSSGERLDNVIDNLIEFTTFDNNYHSATDRYIRFPNGIMIVFGTFAYKSGTANTKVTETVNLVYPFKTFWGYVAKETIELNSSAYDGQQFNIPKITNTNNVTQLKFERKYSSGGYNNGGYYIAIGLWK